MNVRRDLLILGSLLLGMTSSPWAQEYPSKTVTLVVGYPPGGAVDAVARMLAQNLAPALGKAVVVDNRGGASGNIGADYVAKSAPDGHTLLVGPITGYAMNAALNSQGLNYKLDKDFSAVSLVGYLPLVLTVNSGSPSNNIGDFIKTTRKEPGRLSYGSSGNGQIDHIAGEMFKRQAGVSIVHIPYRGAAPAVLDLASGQIQVLFATTATAVANIKTGKIKPLMVASPNRLGVLPEVPTATEAGLKGFEVGSTYGVLAPAGTPPQVLERLNREIARVMENPNVKSRYQTLGIEMKPSSVAEAQDTVTAEMHKWQKTVTELAIQP